ncbi:hypothetical protein DL765_009594 [Monosporascus sp. GIB2]|nr:hypothetical protein DL765_009594 [Monosporascus sp. GIB2]
MQCDVVEFLEVVGKIQPHGRNTWFAARHEQSLQAAQIVQDATDCGRTAATGVEPGYAMLTLEGPGQGTLLPQHGIPLRPEFVFDASVCAQIATSFPVRWEFALSMTTTSTAAPGDTLPRFCSSSVDYAPEVTEGARSWTPSSVRPCSRARRAPSTPRRRAAPWPSAMRPCGCPKSAKELWIPEEGGLGGLTAKAVAWALLAQETFSS